MSRAVAILCCALLASVAFAQDAGEVAGLVINSATRIGISGVAVKLFTQLGQRYETTTNGQGEFGIRGMKPGEYFESFEREGFATPDAGPVIIAKRIQVDGKTPARIDAEMVPLGKISGRVVDSDGRPVAEVLVSLEGTAGPRTPSATTSADGLYAFDKLLPGSWVILAKPKLPGGDEQKLPAGGEQKTGERIEPVFTYFPSARNREQAAPVALRAGADVSGNEIRLRSVPVHSVRGVVLDESGHPASGAIVSLRSREAVASNMAITMFGSARTWYPGPGMGIEAGNTETRTDGKFEFASVGDGEWIVHAETPWGYIEETKKDIQAVGDIPVSVSQKDIDDVQVHLTTNFDLPIEVEFEDAADAKGRGGLMLILASSDGRPEIFGDPNRNGKLVIDRAYPGRYRVLATTSRPGYYVASVDYGGRPVNGPIDIAPGAPPLHFVLRKHAGIVRGTIEKGAPATVILAASAQDDVVQGVTAAAAGSFQFDNLRPGSYSIVAVDRVDDQKMGDSAFVTSLMRSAQTISVQEDANPAITLPVNRWPE